MKKNNVATGVLVAGVAVLSAAMAEQAYGQGLHGVTIAKGCVSPLCVGETTSCDIQLGYNDDFGDTIEILTAWDVQDLGGDNVRVPDMGDLPIVAVGGNTTCTVGGSLPCMIGPGGSTLSGLPGDPQPGFVRFRQDTYVVEPDDPDVLKDQATVEWEDLCDDPDTSGCGEGVVNPAPAPASTVITRCDDDDECTTDVCELGECTFTPIECDDEDPCTTDECVLGICVFTTVDCDDDDACTEDVCDPETGECKYTPNYVCDDGDECTEDTCDPATGECVFTPIDPPPPGCEEGDGCTPGFWKQRHHLMYWMNYSPEDLFDDVFGVDGTGDKSLLGALWSRGGGEMALMRHAVAALLNAASDEVNYLYTEAEVIAMVQEAYATGEFNDIKDMLEMENDRGCTVDKSGKKPKTSRAGLFGPR